MKSSAFRIAAGVLLASALAAPQMLWSQSFPVKPIRIVVPFAPGVSLDTLARRMGQKMSEAFAQPVVIDNAGGVAIIGTGQVARAAPDGHTIAFITVGEVIGAVYLRRDLTYDPVKDLTPIMAAVEARTFLVAHPSTPGNTLKDMIDYAKRNPGKLTYASAGIGSYFHLTGELLKREAGIDLLHVPYKSTPPAMTDTASGQVNMTFAAMVSAKPFLNRIRILGVLEANRNPLFPNVPSISEVVPGFEKLATWFAYFGPAGMPRPIVARLNAEMAKALAAPDLRAWLEENGLVTIASTPEQLAALHKKGLETYGQLIKQVGIKAE